MPTKGAKKRTRQRHHHRADGERERKARYAKPFRFTRKLPANPPLWSHWKLKNTGLRRRRRQQQRRRRRKCRWPVEFRAADRLHAADADANAATMHTDKREAVRSRSGRNIRATKGQPRGVRPCVFCFLYIPPPLSLSLSLSRARLCGI